MDKQIHIYSVDTSFFYNEKEMKLHNRLNKNYAFRNKLKKIKAKCQEVDKLNKINVYIKNINKRITKIKDKLYYEFSLNREIRTLNRKLLNTRNIISVFDSVLTRTLKIKENELSEDIIVVQTYFFDILKDIILNGFMHNGEKYICFTASAGQIRTKKTIFIRESVWLKHHDSLMCGLTIDKINEHGGVNINKYLAYLALCNSATDTWNDFDISKAIVVDDMETTIRCVVDFIDEKTYEIKRQEMDIPITHTDGCGMILPRKNKKNMMVRLPWVKGLLMSFPFDKFIREAKQRGIECGEVTDIYGKKYDLIKDGIEVIFTKSQFKMWKYYSSWDEYKENYIKYDCQAGKCNEEEDEIDNAKINYQMLQTLTDITDDELLEISKTTRKHILDISKDRSTMLKVLGVTDTNKHKNYLQQALEIYPELLNDKYSKHILKQVKKSLVKHAKAGKIDIEGKYTFISPDLYAFCEYLILKNKDPKGLINNGEVYCDLYDDEIKLDVLRSPHLYREHALRLNVVDKGKKRWFVTNAIYTSCHDPISKILMFDNDGDKGLVCANQTIVSVAKRNMQDIVPLFYNMAKAGATIVNNQSIYDGLKTAYTGGNIGIISNNISKIWNNPDVNLDAIRFLCAENNYVIDFAKTLYKPVRPKDKNKVISKYIRAKVPHFFIYAKNYDKKNVEPINNSVVNRLDKLIPNPVLNFKHTNVGRFDYRMLLSNKDKDIILDQDIIDKYKEFDLRSHFMINMDEEKIHKKLYAYKEIKEKLIENNDPSYVVDILVDYLYKHENSSFKTTLWECFGDILVDNLKNNIEHKFEDGYIQCEGCGRRIKVIKQRQIFCDICYKRRKKEFARKRKIKFRSKLCDRPK